MKIICVAYNDWTQEQRNALDAAGFIPKAGYGRVEIEKLETNRKILDLIDKWGVKKFAGTIFERKDLDPSSLFAYLGVWDFGYPQPENNFEYIKVTYDTVKCCKECGSGAVQKAPFQIRRQPNWGRKTMFGLNWVMDEIFVNGSIYEQVFKKYGIQIMPVIQFNKNTVLDDTFQLKIPVVDVALKLDDFQYVLCKSCGLKKYDPQIRGFFPGFKAPLPEFHIFKSQEYFGSGGQAYNRIFFSKRLFNDLQAFGSKVNVAPVDPNFVHNGFDKKRH